MACKANRAMQTEGGVEYTGLKYVQFDQKEPEFCWGLCCVQGCIIGTCALIIMFVILPAGIMMVFHGSDKRNNVTFSAGICLLAFPFVLMCPAFLAYRWRHRALKEKAAHQRMKKQKYEYKNDQNEEEDFDSLEEDVV